MRTFEITVVRDGSSLMIGIPEIDGLTQARHSEEIEEMAREYIALDTGTPIEDMAV